MAKWSATVDNLPTFGERVISSVKWKAVISEIYDYMHTVRTASYGTTEPTAENGQLWYDTNVGENKLKVKTADGWAGISSELPLASTTEFGVIKVGSNLTITDGVLSGSSAEAVKLTATISASNWTGTSAPYSNIVTVNGIDADSTVEVTPASTITSTELKAMQDANLIDGGSMGTNYFTLKAYGSKPTINIPILVTLSGAQVDSTTFTIPTATTSTLGGIKVGSGLSIVDGILSTSGGVSLGLVIALS